MISPGLDSPQAILALARLADTSPDEAKAIYDGQSTPKLDFGALGQHSFHVTGMNNHEIAKDKTASLTFVMDDPVEIVGITDRADDFNGKIPDFVESADKVFGVFNEMYSALPKEWQSIIHPNFQSQGGAVSFSSDTTAKLAEPKLVNHFFVSGFNSTKSTALVSAIRAVDDAIGATHIGFPEDDAAGLVMSGDLYTLYPYIIPVSSYSNSLLPLVMTGGAITLKSFTPNGTNIGDGGSADTDPMNMFPCFCVSPGPLLYLCGDWKGDANDQSQELKWTDADDTHKFLDETNNFSAIDNGPKTYPIEYKGAGVHDHSSFFSEPPTEAVVGDSVTVTLKHSTTWQYGIRPVGITNTSVLSISGADDLEQTATLNLNSGSTQSYQFTMPDYPVIVWIYCSTSSHPLTLD